MTNILTKPRLIGLVVAMAIFAADQWLKDYVLNTLGLNQEGQSVEILSFFNLTFIKNPGISLGMFEATSPEMRWLLVGLTALIALIVFVWMMREKALGDILGLSLILGGALGNIVDRYNLGYVIDYADLHFGDFRPFLIFNVADAAITIGVLIILARSFFVRDKDESETNETAPA
ncbi:signal peptidase II [Pontixanthobacter aquaemixtae]|uniref:Lipoprotein signal peptidase n=1 Tax=Pontixanthobacter aquaemixtae TaxID=1958940 RepID=A0A844ZUA3_9SPHN|nr:signal peptidase II [Pontixanthobacter aquaemixtae]MXO91318.1 signal peptidase II [Pontixanthobacter aquaemixtae]